MEALFLHLLNISITASYVAIAVILLRLLFKKAPRWISCLLWGFVAFRLVCPVSFESVLSLIPEKEAVEISDIAASEEEEDVVGNTAKPTVPIVGVPLAPPVLEAPTEPSAPALPAAPEADGAGKGDVAWFIVGCVWLAGVAAMLIYAAVSYLLFRRRVGEAAKQGDVWLCDRISAPFILGVFRPRIYMPTDISAEDSAFVTAHEKAHIKRLDHLWKPFGFVLLSVYWFNPVMWLSYWFLCRDIEIACDEKVIKEKGECCKVGYSTALINCSVSRNSISACPVAFGETAAKERVKNVLSYKKPAFWIIVLAVIACIVAAVLLLTDKPEEKPKGDESSAADSQEISDSADTSKPPTESQTPSGDKQSREEWLKEHYSEYYDLPVDNGLTVYVSQFASESYNFALVANKAEGEYTWQELLSMIGIKMGVKAEDMKSILDTYFAKYDMEKMSVRVIPYVNPLSSYIGDVKANDVAYMEKVRQMLDLGKGMYVLGGKGYAQRASCPELLDRLVEDMAAKNEHLKNKAADSELPLVEITSREQLGKYLALYAEDAENPDIKLFARYDDEYFKENCLLMAFTYSPSGSIDVYQGGVYLIGAELEFHIDKDYPEHQTDDVALHYVFKEARKSDLAHCNSYTVLINNKAEENNKSDTLIYEVKTDYIMGALPELVKLSDPLPIYDDSPVRRMAKLCRHSL